MRTQITHALPLFAVAMLAASAGAADHPMGHVDLAMAGGTMTGVTGLFVTVNKVDAHINNRWVRLIDSPVEVNLLDAAAVPALLASADAPAGRYTKLRFRFSDAKVEDANGMHSALMPHGVEMLHMNFVVREGESLSLLVAFDVAASVVRHGRNGHTRYTVRPKLRPGTEATAGTVTGYTSDGVNRLPGVTVSAVYFGGGAYPSGTVVVTTTSAGDGTFNLGSLPTGTYELRFRYVSPTGQVLQSVMSLAIAGGMNTDLGEVVLF